MSQRLFTRLVLIFIPLLLVAPNLPASDFAKEQRWAEQIVDMLIEGDAVWLEAGGHRFLAIYTQAQADDPKRGVIVMHGIGVHPNWDQVIYPLRTGLAERGMSTLSLQMPILPNEAEAIEYAPLIATAGPRIEAGIRFLKAKGVAEIVIAAHSLGATMAAHYLAGEAADVRALVAIGMGGRSDEPRMDTVSLLGRIHIPVLDLYGSDDLPQVLRSVAQRATAARAAGNKAYREIRVADTNHFFDGKDDVLLDTVSDWLAAALWTMLLVPNWENLTGECGWSTRQYVRWMKTVAKRTFIDESE
ncbi:MAG: alpha/beta hydrolase family protein [Gammaproteobacteria bacterium]|nr:alpha/beta hydrolase family protein [Gammaproteobacteria bacterium]